MTNTGPDVAEQFDAGGWKFTPEVAAVFDDHVRASVPHYDVIQDLVAQASDWLLPAGGMVADLGASTGTTVELILDRQPSRHRTAVLYDEVPEMCARAETRFAQAWQPGTVKVLCQRVQDGLAHTDADLTLALFFLQFLPWRERLTVLRAAREAASDTGAILIAEKVRPTEVRWAEIATDCSHDWKEQHGISDAAIRAKARALRGVLVPHTLAELTGALTAAGWEHPEVLYRWHQWVLVGAFAEHPHG